MKLSRFLRSSHTVLRPPRQGILLVLMLVACTQSPDQAGHTVEYYRAHVSEREATVAQCANDPGSRRDSAACVNAREAARLEDVGSLKNLPPMGLPGKPADPVRPR